MISQNALSDARRLLQELKAILQREGETNCIRGVIAAIESLDDSNAEQGFAEARSIYKTVAQGKAPLSDYYIKRVNPTEQAEANKRLDELRDDLWRLFE